MRIKISAILALFILVALTMQGCGSTAPTAVPTAVPTATAAAKAVTMPDAVSGDNPTELKGAINAGEPTPISCGETTDEAFIAQVIVLVNAERAKVGAPPLTENPKLKAAATVHNNNMICLDFLSHTGQDGSQPDERIRAQGYDWANFGENIARSYLTPETAMEAWMNSPGHKANILNPIFTEIGVAYAFKDDDTGGDTRWTQVFGLPKPEPTATPIPPLPVSCGETTNAAFIGQVVALVNAERAKVGVAPLTEDPRLDAAAKVHTNDMACQNYFSEDGKDGSSTRTWVTAQGYDAASLTMNIAGSITTPEALVQGWMSKTFERGNILSPNYSATGVAFASKEGTDKVTYWSQIFARPQR